MRYVFAVLAAIMVVFAALQYDDPDGPLWMLYYGVPAFWSALAAIRPASIASRTGRLLLGLSLAAGAALAIWYWPPVAGFWHEEVWRMSGAVQGDDVAEKSREGMGLMLAVLVLLCVFVAGSIRRGGEGPVAADRPVGHEG